MLTVPIMEHQSCFWQLVAALYHSCVKLMSRWVGLALRFDTWNIDFGKNTSNKNTHTENLFKNAENQEFKFFVWLYFRNLSKTQSVKSSSIWKFKAITLTANTSHIIRIVFWKRDFAKNPVNLGLGIIFF